MESVFRDGLGGKSTVDPVSHTRVANVPDYLVKEAGVFAVFVSNCITICHVSLQNIVLGRPTVFSVISGPFTLISHTM